jgi:phosphatidylglycerol:prolipoprotein diacylglycerol transferase
VFKIVCLSASHLKGRFFMFTDPVAFSLGPLDIRWYALAYIAGIVLGWAYALHLVSHPSYWGNRASAITRAHIHDFLNWAVIGIILGGRLGYVLFYHPSYYAAHPLEILAVWEGGMSFHGGLIGVTLAMILFARRYGLNPWSLFDVIGAAAPLGLFFGRLANFVNGELWGRPADVPWAIVFPAAGPEPRHPSQLYEAGLEGVLLFLLCWMAIRAGALKKPGLVTGLFVGGYGLARFGVEFFREPDAHLGLFGNLFSMGQMLSLPMILLGLALVLRALMAKPSGSSPLSSPS